MVRIFRVEAPDFVAAFLVRPESTNQQPAPAEVVYHTAPKLNGFKGKSLKNALKICRERGWVVEEIKG